VAKTLVQNNLGGAGTPQEVKDLRRSSFDLHGELGYPVIIKHRWNLQDEREGRAQRCPLHDELYDDSPKNCPYCFGTGYVGGFADGVIVYVTIQDAPQDIIRMTPQGVLQMDQHPQMTAPWIPELGDGDLVILADFEPGSWDVADTHERYTLREVTPITIRGPGWGRQNSSVKNRFRVSQESAIDKVPYGHEFNDVPIVFDPEDVPTDPTPPDEPDPPQVGTFTSYRVGFRVTGGETGLKTKETQRDIRVAVEGVVNETSYGVRIRGVAEGTTIINL
jgi:hypothetical protein